MPKKTDEEKAARHAAMQEGLKTAIQVPLSVMRLADEAWESMQVAAQYGNPASKSDVQVGARSLETGIWGAWQNVLINMTDIEDERFKTETLEEAAQIAKRAKDSCAEVLAILEKR